MPTKSEMRMKRDSFGGCTFAVMSPKALNGDTNTVSVVLSFEEALKLNLAIDEAVHQIGRYNRATVDGKRAGLMLVLHFKKRRVRVQHGRVAPQHKDAKSLRTRGT
jgi:hypothetical protein